MSLEITIEKYVPVIISIKEFIDSPVTHTIVAKTNLGPIVLWEGEELYNKIGDWTTQNAIDRITEIYSRKDNRKEAKIEQIRKQ